MISICPIGTCRIHTPLKRGRNDYAYTIEKARNYGFTHTSLEARQQLRFMFGDLDIPDKLKPLIFRRGIEGSIKPELATQSDFYLIESSSSKSFTLDGFALQINYLYLFFDEFFSEFSRRTQFAKLASRSSPDALQDWLAAQPQFARLRPDQQDLLASVRVSEETQEDIQENLAAILAMTGSDKLIVTTHVNAVDEKGRPLEKREKNIADVRSACDNLGLPCFDPTELMKSLGQENALLKDGRDLTHFTEKFADALVSEWNMHFFGAPALDIVHDRSSFNVAHYQQELAAGNVIEASRSLRDAVRAYPRNLALRLEQARLDVSLGNYEGALASFDELGTEPNLSEADQEALLISILGTGDAKRALQLGESLLADETESETIYATTARAAAQIGQTEQAISYWKRLFYRGEMAMEAASEILDLIGDGAGSAARRDQWVALVLEKYPEHEDALAALWDAAIAKRAHDRLFYLLGQSQHLSDATALTLAEKCCKAEMHAIGVKLLMSRHTPEPVDADSGTDAHDPLVARWLDEHSPQWLEEGLDALEQADFEGAAQRINAAYLAGDKAAKKPHRNLSATMLRQAREAYKAKDHELVLRIVASAHQAAVKFRQMHLLAGRSHYARKEYHLAVERFLRHAQGTEFDEGVAMATARAAILDQRYPVAIGQLLAIVERGKAGSKKLIDARTKLVGLVGRAIRQARELTAEARFDAARQLIDLVARIEGTEDRVFKERRKIASELKNYIRVLDSSEYAKRMELGKLLFEIDPTNEYAAKNAAVGAMKSGRFKTAIHYFEAMRPLTDNKEQVDFNIAKCQTQLEKAVA